MPEWKTSWGSAASALPMPAQSGPYHLSCAYSATGTDCVLAVFADLRKIQRDLKPKMQSWNPFYLISKENWEWKFLGILTLKLRQVKSRDTEGLESVFENLKSSESVPREYQSPEKKKETNKKRKWKQK